VYTIIQTQGFQFNLAGLEMSYPTLTPQRPLPGTYFATPLPGDIPNAPNFQTKTPSVPAGQSAPALSPPKVSPAAPKSKNETLNTRQRAARTINDTLAQESRYPDLDSYLSRKLIALAILSFCGLRLFAYPV
jgi:nuclear pore complex protein Nup155